VQEVKEMVEDGREQPTGMDETAVDEKEKSWGELGRRWYEELKAEEGVLAPWIHWEWNGERLKPRRG